MYKKIGIIIAVMTAGLMLAACQPAPPPDAGNEAEIVELQAQLDKAMASGKANEDEIASLQAELEAAEATAAEAAEATEEPASPGDFTLTVGWPFLPSGFDPAIHSGNATNEQRRNMGESLIYWAKVTDPDNPGAYVHDYSVVEGLLAESWTVSDDGLVWTFTLREGVLSHAKNKMTAADVKYTWDRHFGTEGYGSFLIGLHRLKSADSVVVIDDYTIEFTTIEPVALAALAGIYANTQSHILDSAEYLANSTSDDPFSTKWAATNYAGFGPYMLEEFTSGSQMVLVAHEDYWKGAPEIKRVIVREIPDGSTRAILAATGELDIAEWLDASTAVSLQDTESVSVWSGGNLWAGLIINNDTPPLDNVLVRQALSYATPYDAVRKVAYSGLAKPWRSLGVPDFLIGYTEENFPYDENLDTARDLLAEAGYEEGELELTLRYASQFAGHDDICGLIKTSWAQIGVTVTCSAIPEAQLDEIFGGVPLFIWEDSWLSPDPGYTVYVSWYTGGAWNPANYSNAQYDAEVLQCLQTMDLEERVEVCNRATKYPLAEAAWIFLAAPAQNIAHDSCLTGLTWYTSRDIRFDSLSVGPDC